MGTFVDAKVEQLKRLEAARDNGDTTLASRIDALKQVIKAADVYEAIEGKVRAVAVTDDIELVDRFILATGGASGITETLPPVADAVGQLYTIKKVDAGAGAVTVDGDANIEGAASLSLAAQYDVATVLSDGTVWHIVSKNIAA